MKFKINQVEFDFADDPSEGSLDTEAQNKIYYDTKSKIWEVDEEGDLTDAISDSTGWCVRSIDYQEV